MPLFCPPVGPVMPRRRQMRSVSRTSSDTTRPRYSSTRSEARRPGAIAAVNSVTPSVASRPAIPLRPPSPGRALVLRAGDPGQLRTRRVRSGRCATAARSLRRATPQQASHSTSASWPPASPNRPAPRRRPSARRCRRASTSRVSRRRRAPGRPSGPAGPQPTAAGRARSGPGRGLRRTGAGGVRARRPRSRPGATSVRRRSGAAGWSCRSRSRPPRGAYPRDGGPTGTIGPEACARRAVSDP